MIPTSEGRTVSPEKMQAVLAERARGKARFAAGAAVTYRPSGDLAARVLGGWHNALCGWVYCIEVAGGRTIKVSAERLVRSGKGAVLG